ncbi:SusC/RagA family TonB-linked outer membrane protein [Salegentibacter maritimus]|uniref:TonB-dependent receptor n=1 Tax=Salegentibacter maritimus TaxID=2794347 RepID=A0ABS0TIC5_9FLAO|nr:TonB-dependent receptor [Salegentibacter maritimus]MBI6120817.1 TonB-dependent receptor [Salegentibacter maritimus]
MKNSYVFVLFFCLMFSGVYAQENIIVTGTVLDAKTGIPVPSANIIEKGTSNGTMTDFDGNYSIEVPKNATLEISFLGYATKEVKVDGRNEIDIDLEEDASALEEVVVVGFGSQKRENVTGAVSTINMDEMIEGRPLSNATSAIEGTIPGLQITSGTGRPGTNPDLQIRGFESINGGEPLVLVNNVPMSINNINPRDIESITVLKDAAASSIYGARAAFGVVLITTKSGNKNQDPKISYSSVTSFDQPTELPKKASTFDFINALNDWGTVGFWTGQDIPTWVNLLEQYRQNPENFPDGQTETGGVTYPLTETDVIGDFYGDTGISQIHNASITGGGENSKYRIGAGFSDEDGIIVTDNDSFKKYTFNTDYSLDVTSNLLLNLNVNYLNSLTKDPFGNYYNAITFPPYVPLGNFETEDGTLVPFETPGNLERINPPRETTRDNLRVFTKLQYSPFKNLSLTGEYSYGYNSHKRINVDKQVLTANPERYSLNSVSPENTFFRKETGEGRYHAINIYGNYEKNIDRHNLNLLVGYNQEEQRNESYWARRTNLIDPNLPSLSQATGVLTSDDSYGEWSIRGVFGRINYNFAEKYFLELNGRYDGSSRFPENNRWGFFPSASIGWNIAKEKFFENLNSKVSMLKFRASYGEIGNQDIRFNNGALNLYPSIPGLAAINSSWIDPATGLRLVTLSSPQLVSSSFTWETARTSNLGVDISVFNNRLSGSFDTFKRETVDMIAPGAELSAVLGAAAPVQNVANLKSIGWEAEMKWRDKLGDFSYYIAFNVSDSQSEITKFDNEEGLLGQYYEGQKIGEIWGYESNGKYTVDDFIEGSLNENLQNGVLKDGVVKPEGIAPNPGDVMYKDLNGDGIINNGNNTLNNPGDRKIIGNNTRRYRYGIRTGASYKNFDISFFLQGVGKRDVWMNNDLVFPYRGEFSVVYDHQLDYWTPNNQDAYYPRVYPLGGGNYPYSRRTQTKYLGDGSYIRLNNVTVGYNLSENLLKNIFIESVRVFTSGENLFYKDKLPDGLNAEFNNISNGGNYPLLKKYALGINVTF